MIALGSLSMRSEAGEIDSFKRTGMAMMASASAISMRLDILEWMDMKRYVRDSDCGGHQDAGTL
jgi:hypothetical protein